MSRLSFLRDNARYLSAGATLSFTSSYGQTYFIAIFAGVILADFGLSNGEWGILYTISTTVSAAVMFWAGALTDHFRVRGLAMIVLPALCLICLAMAANTTVTGLAFIIFALRLFGQGMTSQLAITAMARWFVARRGLALAISALGFAAGQSVFPVVFAALLEVFHWRWLWVLAACLILVKLPIILLLLRQERTPQTFAESTDAVGMDGKHWTRNEVLRSPIFWLLLPMLLGPPAWGTALFFQQVHIAEVKGWPLVQYLALLPVLTVVSVSTTLISGGLIDRFGSGMVARLYLIPFSVAFLILATADTLWVAAIALVVFGLGSGTQAALPTAFWSEYFGTRHIGAIKAVSTSVMVFGSAVGPGVSGVLIDYGFTFPEQSTAIAAYFAASVVFVWIAVARARPRLRGAAEIDVERA